MEVSEQELSFADEFVLRLDRLFHLYDHVGCGIHIFNGREDFCSYCCVLLIGETAAFTSCVLYKYFVTIFH